MERLERSLQRGIAAFRWLAWTWMATVLILARRALDRPVAAVALVLAAGLVTLWLTVLLRRDPGRLGHPVTVGIEVGVALALLLADGSVYSQPHVFTGTQPLGVAWTLAALLAAGVAFGPVVGALTGVVAGAARAVSSVTAVVPDPDPWLGVLTPVQVLSLGTTAVLYALAGGVAGYGAGLLRDAEHRIAAAERTLAAARAREHVARRLHDGVLQTLAVVERRADDPALARLARDQERDLRSFLAGDELSVPQWGPSSDPPDAEPRHAVPRPAASRHVGRPHPAPPPLAAALRAVASRTESTYPGRVEVLVPDDLGDLDAEVVTALTGAVGEALTNAARHGGATRTVVYAEPLDDDRVFVSVRDDGAGFDPAAVTEGMGLTRSVRGRITEVGGDVEVVSSPDHGAEVRLTVPRLPRGS